MCIRDSNYTIACKATINSTSIIYQSMELKKLAKVLFLGIDQSGKTTLLYRLKLDEVVTTIPTIGFNVETITIGNVEFTIWDIGGSNRIRSLWPHYYDTTGILAFFVNSHDTDSIEASREELQKIKDDAALQGARFVIVATKADLQGTMETQEIRQRLGAGDIPVIKCSSMTKEGLNELLNFLQENATNNKGPGESCDAIGGGGEKEETEERAQYEIAKNRIDAIREIVDKLGVKEDPLVEDIERILNAKEGEKISVSKEGQVMISKN
eukprot:TRINITY_DN12876_c0_g2_i7.p1 TRINITY_DN12876_c0_g2~~TRINITY_DN12876_c0_g2_i7.p1  ORF type:complete len:268 (-),score=55.21 TRINITY_DN12876_c0_g2_i7:107-910(-)